MMTTRTSSIALASTLTAAVALAGCAGTTDAEQATGATNGAAAADVMTAPPGTVADAIESVQPAMLDVLLLDENPIENYDAAYDWLDKGRETIDELDAALPDALGDATDEEQQLYREMLASLDEWRRAIEEIRTELEDRREEFEAANDEWVEAFDDAGGSDQERADAAGEPPEEYMAVLERNEIAAAAWGDACARFADAADLTVDCYAYEAGN